MNARLTVNQGRTATRRPTGSAAGASALCMGIGAGAYLAGGAATGMLCAAQPVLRVCYAGSMGAVMERKIFPAFRGLTGIAVRGTGRGAFGLARELAAGELTADVFISVTSGPLKLLPRKLPAAPAVPIARTCMVLAYCPHGPATKLFRAAREPWYSIILHNHLLFGRTDPRTDPQGRSTILALKLAQRYYNQPGLEAKIAGRLENPAQIFTESSLMFRLQSGQMDACITYQSQAAANHLPFISLPRQVNLGSPEMDKAWYRHVEFQLPAANGKPQVCRASPLVFYAVILRDKARQHETRRHEARRFVQFLRSGACSRMLVKAGYKPIGGRRAGKPGT